MTNIRLLARLGLAIASTVTLNATLGFAAEEEPQDLGALLESRKDLSTFNSLIRDYPDILLKLPNYGGVTIVAPSDKAFENIAGTPLNEIWDPKNASIAVPILEYHILQGTISTGALVSGPSVFKRTLLTSKQWTNVTAGQNVVVNKQPGEVIIFSSAQGARTTQTKGDMRFAGGLLHIVDNLLIPPTRLEQTLEAFSLDSFLGALHAAEMLPAIAEQQNITIFAPRDEALALVGGTLSNLDPDALARVVGYHLVPGRILSSAELTNGTRLDTRSGNGAIPTVRRSGNDLYVDSARVVQPDILVANGVLHVIENVLNPDAGGVVPNPEAATQAPVWPCGLSYDDSNGDGEFIQDYCNGGSDGRIAGPGR
ncbi:FAS1 domain-containing protein [Plectosphaerella plurivora]|uniref:FAS1 domain-containing protein n=1 Tax=Plectosphaerella plurivora TaxID=936078 RepID=A0A9P8VEQ0_9PEZI|nr:FAS1 domain-containing protein [Plectosphaerella plurivora]